ncbi:MAG TPA: hypothetical protein PLO37_15585 [Candidatus Hydrogenedentes bacterium]|nr:hypothetical protein [Candidatus Hydrogenedentota bacterium]
MAFQCLATLLSWVLILLKWTFDGIVVFGVWAYRRIMADIQRRFEHRDGPGHGGGGNPADFNSE